MMLETSRGRKERIRAHNEEVFDNKERRKVAECKRYAYMCAAGSPERLFWLRRALSANAARWQNFETVATLYPLVYS